MAADSRVNRVASLPGGDLLRLALKVDALVTGVTGVTYVIAANPLKDLLGLDPALTRGLGAFLFVFAAAVWIVATRPTLSPRAVTAVMEANLLWVGGSVMSVALAVSSPTVAGSVWMVLQALGVASFAVAQAYARRGALPA